MALAGLRQRPPGAYVIDFGDTRPFPRVLEYAPTWVRECLKSVNVSERDLEALRYTLQVQEETRGEEVRLLEEPGNMQPAIAAKVTAPIGATLIGEWLHGTGQMAFSIVEMTWGSGQPVPSAMPAVPPVNERPPVVVPPPLQAGYQAIEQAGAARRAGEHQRMEANLGRRLTSAQAERDGTLIEVAFGTTPREGGSFPHGIAARTQHARRLNARLETGRPAETYEPSDLVVNPESNNRVIKEQRRIDL